MPAFPSEATLFAAIDPAVAKTLIQQWFQATYGSRGTDIASAATINLTTASGDIVDVTGTTTITAITLADGAQRTVRFTGALTLTNGASLVLPGGASIPTAAGDFAVFRGYAAGVVRCVFYSRASGQPVRMTIVDRAYAEYTANANLTAQIPFDDTAPTNTEGTQILSLTITPKSSTNRLRVRVQAEGALNTIDNWALAIFEGATCRASSRAISSVADHGVALVVEKEWTPGVTSALTISVRVGPQGASTLRLNGNTAGRTFGGTQAATLVVEEIAA